MNSSKDINLKDEYYSSFERLSYRSKNLIENHFGGIDKMLEHYLRFETFLNIRNAGAKSNMELCSYSYFF